MPTVNKTKTKKGNGNYFRIFFFCNVSVEFCLNIYLNIYNIQEAYSALAASGHLQKNI